jgi:hypothetical protein
MNPASHEEIREQLIKTSGYLKKQIAGAHVMRTIPELTFFYDDTEDRAEKVDKLLASIKDNYDDEDAYDPDIDLDDYLDDDEYYDLDEDEDLYDDLLDDEEEDDEEDDEDEDK